MAPREPTNALSRWWRNESVITRVLGVAGAIVTLAGLVMLLVLAVQQQWFGPVPESCSAHCSPSPSSGSRCACATASAPPEVRPRGTGPRRDGVCRGIPGRRRRHRDLWLAPARRRAGSGPARRRLGSGHRASLGQPVPRRPAAPRRRAHGPLARRSSSWVLSAFMVVLALGSWPVQLGRTWPWATLARVLPAALVVVVGALANQFHRLSSGPMSA